MKGKIPWTYMASNFLLINLLFHHRIVLKKQLTNAFLTFANIMNWKISIKCSGFLKLFFATSKWLIWLLALEHETFASRSGSILQQKVRKQHIHWGVKDKILQINGLQNPFDYFFISQNWYKRTTNVCILKFLQTSWAERFLSYFWVF